MSKSLRFGKSDWLESEFSNIAFRQKRKAFPSQLDPATPCIELDNIESNTGRLVSVTDIASQKSTKGVFKKGDVLYSKLRPYLRKYVRPSFSGVSSSEVWILSSGVVSGEFLFQLIQTEKFNRAANVSSGSKMPRADWEYVSSVIFSYPECHEEQQKIADFLTSVDTRIQQLKQKQSLLQQYKKGLMQQLFSQTLRFKDDNGNTFPDWDHVKLGKAVEVNPRTSSLPEEFLYIDLESVKGGRLGDPKLVQKADAPSRAQRGLKKSDILFQTVRPYQKNNFFFSREGSYVASTGYAQLRTTRNSPQFIYQYLHLDSFVSLVLNRCTGTSYPAINSSDLADVKIKLPCVEEQTKIANALAAMDKKIDLVAQQIEHTQTFKKGLLQQMFV